MIRKKTYQEIFADVCRYVSSVANSEIHATKKRVLHWDEYANALMSAKALSFEWTNSIAAELISLPNNILDQDISIKSNFDLADSICSKLIHKPDDEKLKNTLNDTIGYIQLDLSPICAQIQKVLTLLHKYHDTLN